MYIATIIGMSKTRKEEYADATRAALLDSAQSLFADKGYHGTSVDEICTAARVTKGALYHHYRNKEDLFADLVEALEMAFVDTVARTLSLDKDSWALALEGIDQFLDHCLDPAYRRIVLVDAPNVLGARRINEIGERTASGLLRGLFERLIDEKVIAKQPVDIAVRLFSSLIIEGGLLIGESKTPAKTKKEVRRTIVRFLESLT